MSGKFCGRLSLALSIVLLCTAYSPIARAEDTTDKNAAEMMSTLQNVAALRGVSPDQAVADAGSTDADKKLIAQNTPAQKSLLKWLLQHKYFTTFLVIVALGAAITLPIVLGAVAADNRRNNRENDNATNQALATLLYQQQHQPIQGPPPPLPPDPPPPRKPLEEMPL